MSWYFSIAFILSAVLLAFSLKRMADGGWLKAMPFRAAVIAYCVGLFSSLAVTAFAQYDGTVIGATEEPHGSFLKPNHYSYTPIYKGEDAWIGLVILLPFLLFVLSRLDSMPAPTKFRWYLILLFPFWLILAIVCNSYFFDSFKPVFRDKELTAPYVLLSIQVSS
jgi:hypothetical protein